MQPITRPGKADARPHGAGRSTHQSRENRMSTTERFTQRAAVLGAIATTILGCGDPAGPSWHPVPSAALQSPASTLYKLRFITGVNPAGDGELQSGWFPDAGIALNTRAPWKSVTVNAATIDLVNFTHGSWTAGSCATFTSAKPINVTNWDIAGTSPVLTFAGTWRGTLSISQTAGTGVGFDGDRVVNGLLTLGAGGIHNVVGSGTTIETRDPTANNDWFRLEIRDAALKFGSASSPDGMTNPVGVEVACANFTIEARKLSLITP